MPEFMLDITADLTEEQLKQNYLRLSRAVGELQTTILFMLQAKGDPDKLPEPYKTRVKNLIAAYDD